MTRDLKKYKLRQYARKPILLETARTGLGYLMCSKQLSARGAQPRWYVKLYVIAFVRHRHNLVCAITVIGLTDRIEWGWNIKRWNFFSFHQVKKRERMMPAWSWALPFLASYSINRNTVVFPLFTVHSLAWWAYIATIRRKFTACNEPAVTLPPRLPLPQSPSPLPIHIDANSLECVTGAQLFIITLSMSCIFDT